MVQEQPHRHERGEESDPERRTPRELTPIERAKAEGRPVTILLTHQRERDKAAEEVADDGNHQRAVDQAAQAAVGRQHPAQDLRQAPRREPERP